MLYKVTPMMAPPEKPARVPGQPRKKRKSAVFDGEGHEVLISLMCLKCKQVKPLLQFGLRKMADGAIRNQPWCRTCRSGAGAPRPTKDAPIEAVPVTLPVALASAAEPQEVFAEPAAAPEAAPLVLEPEPAPAG
ncbi:MAG: hypothetical protein ACYC8T_24870 [Myxococcaceae bacterium]